MDEPFLPPPVPSDNPAAGKKSNAKSTLLLWLVLIVVFWAIYHLLSPSGPPREESGRSFWDILSGILSVAWPFLLLGVTFTYLWSQFRRGTRFQHAQEPGLAALAEGKLDDAAALFRSLAGGYRRQMQYAAVARYHLSAVLIRQGKLEGAISELIAVEKGAGLLYASEIRLLAAIALGECYGLRGQLEPAQRWIDESRKRLGRGQRRNYAASVLRMSEAVVQCRAGRFDDAVRGLERDWRQLEANLPLTSMRVAWLMRAFAVAQLGGPRGEGAAAPFVDFLRSAPPAYLAAEWPELRTFLAAHSLVSTT